MEETEEMEEIMNHVDALQDIFGSAKKLVSDIAAGVRVSHLIYQKRSFSLVEWSQWDSSKRYYSWTTQHCMLASRFHLSVRNTSNSVVNRSLEFAAPLVKE